MKFKRNEYLQVVGLLALAKMHVKSLNDIERAVAAIFQEQPQPPGGGYFGHVTDAIYSGYSAEELIEKISISRKKRKKDRP